MIPRLARATFRELAERLALLFVASYGLLYFSYKYLQPALGVGDYPYYRPIFEQPLHFHVMQAPFILRQLSAILTWLVWHSHLYYPDEISFADPAYDQHLYFAALVVNYIALVLTALAAGLIAEELLGRRHALLATLAGLLCLTTFHSQSAVITNMVEGPAWTLVTLAFLCYLRRSTVWLAVVMALAIFERELVIMAVGMLAGLDLLANARDSARRRFPLLVLSWSLACFAVYIVLRRHFAGWDFQTHPTQLASGIFTLDFDWSQLVQGLFSQNIIAIALVAFYAARPRNAQVSYWLPKLLAAFALLAFISLLAHERNNTGRLAGILTPMFAAFAAVALVSLQGGITATPHREPPPRISNLPSFAIFGTVSVVILLLVSIPSLHHARPSGRGPKHPGVMVPADPLPDALQQRPAKHRQ